MPQVDAAVGRYAARVFQSGEPVHRVDLVRHPLAGDSRRIGPEQPIFEVFARVERFERAVAQEANPVEVFFPALRNERRTAPAARLVDVPRHFAHHDVAELARADVVVRRVVVRRAATLRTDLEYDARLFDGGSRAAVVLHRFGERFFDVDMLAVFGRLDGVRGVREVRRGDDYRVDVLVLVHLFVVAVSFDLVPDFLSHDLHAFIAAQAPDVRHADHVEVQFLAVIRKTGQQRTAEPVGETDHRHVDAVVGAFDARIAFRTEDEIAHYGSGRYETRFL